MATIKLQQQVETGTLTVTGVEQSKIDAFKKFCVDNKQQQGFIMNQLLEPVAKHTKPAAKKKGATA